jgi:hypothetical protein
MEDGNRGAATNNNLMERDQERPKARARASGPLAWSPRSSKIETMYLSILMAGGCALTSTWGVARKSQMVANVIVVFTYV